jgi:hypothetical protein
MALLTLVKPEPQQGAKYSKSARSSPSFSPATWPWPISWCTSRDLSSRPGGALLLRFSLYLVRRRRPMERRSPRIEAGLDPLKPGARDAYEENSFSIDDRCICDIGLFFWTAWNEGSLGIAHIIGLGASVLILVPIWFWPDNKQPTRPPP